ncbi:MAG: FAD-dependent thymidylate synthase [Acidobacteriota bacterium]
MKVILAGYNVDSQVLEELKENSPARDDVTPETLSAAYARISRDPRPVDRLRKIAREEVERARRSNRNIIFKMGHHSVAEHAVFNFDIIGVSRLAIEEIERFRLGSYTEKSQRYITLQGDFLLPEEVKKAGKESIFLKTVKLQNDLYFRLYKKLRPFIFQCHKELAENPKKHSLLEGWAKEDARYAVCLATLGQLGMTLNARNLEYFIRRMAAKKLIELAGLNRNIYQLAKEVAPSIILFTEASDFDAQTPEDLKNKAKDLIHGENPSREDVRLIDFTPDGDEKLLAALFLSALKASYGECLDRVKKMSRDEKIDLVKTAFLHMEFYDAALREWEFIDLTFELVVSAACFAQLKRHRMATLTVQEYDPSLGVIVPPSVKEIGEEKQFLEVIRKTDEVYEELNRCLENGASYILTNAHRRRVLLKVNARELYHISRLREDATAQWDIRNIAGKMRAEAEKVLPLTCLLIGGKDAYPQIYKKIFGRKPKFSPPPY